MNLWEVPRFGPPPSPPHHREPQHVLAVILQIPALPFRERADADRHRRIHAHPAQRLGVRDRGHDQPAVAFERDEAAVEQVIDGGREQQPVLAVEAFVVGGVAPGLGVVLD